jgi:hypothetical protein
VARALGLAALAALALALVAIAVLLHGLDGRVRDVLLDRAKDLEARIGRPVTIGPVEATIGLEAQVVVHDVVIGAAAGASGPLAAPLVRVPSARVGVDLGLLARSRGRRVEITRVEIERPELSIARTAEGLSTDDVRARLAAAPPSPPGPPGPAAAGIVLRHLAIAGAKVRLVDASSGDAIELDGLSLSGDDLRRDGTSRLVLAASLGSKASNLRATADFAPPAPGGEPALARVEAHAAAVPLPPIVTRFLAARAPALELAGASLTVDATVEPGATTAARGQVALDGVRLAGVGAGGARELGGPFTLAVALDAAANPAAGTLDARSLEVRAAGASLRGSLSLRGVGASPSVESMAFEATGEAAPLLDALPPSLRPRGVLLGGPLAASIRGSGDAAAARGHVELRAGEARLVEDGGNTPDEGRAMPFSVAADVAFAAADGLVRVSSLSVAAGELVVKGAADLASGAPRRVSALELEAHGPLDALVALLPTSRRPRGLALGGAFSVSVSAKPDGDAYAGKAALDLAGASVRGHGLAKARGVPLALEVEGRLHDGGADLARARVRAGSLGVTARGQVHGPDRFDLAFDADVASLAALLALAPAAVERLSPRTSLDGRLGAKGTIRRAGSKIDASAELRLSDAAVRHGLFSLRGAAGAKLHVVASGDEADVDVDADLTAAAVDVALVARKPAGAPSHVGFALRRTRDALRISGAHVDVPGVALAGIEVAFEPRALHVTLGPSSSVALGQLLDAAPLLRARAPAWLASATLRAGLELAGDPEDLAGASLRLTSVDLVSRLGHLRGSASVDAVGRPKLVRVDVEGGELTLPERERGAPTTAEDLAVEAPEGLRVEGRVRLDALRAAGQTVRAIDAELALEGARLRVGALRASALGGAIVLDPSWVELGEVPEVDLHARLDSIDLAALPRGALDELGGRLSGRLDLHGRGATGDALARSLSGTATLSARDVRVKGVWEPKFRFVNKWLAALVSLREKRHPGGAKLHVIDLREASATFAVDRGALATKAPIVLRSDALEARLEGSLGADRRLAFEGTISLAPAVVAAHSDRLLVPKIAVPLRLRIGGRVGAAEIELLDLGETVSALRSGGWNGGDEPPL